MVISATALIAMKPASVPMLRIRYLKAFCRPLEDLGHDIPGLLGKADLDTALLDEPESWITVRQICRFLSIAVKETGYVTLGLDAGIALRRRHSTFSKLVLYSPTLYQSLRSVCANSSSEDTSAKFRVVRDGDLGWIHCGKIEESEEGIRQIETYRYAALLEIVRLAAGTDYLPPRLHFQCDEHAALLDSPLLQGVETRFGEPGLSIAFEPRLFSLPIINVPDVPSTEAGHDSAPLEPGQALLEVTRTQMLSGNPGIEHTAAALGFSVRTLQRLLQEHGMTYAALLQHVRIETAKKMLVNGRAPISEISAYLGYRHGTHFARSFRRVCGLTPREFRQMNERAA